MENRSALIDRVPAVKATASVLRASPFSQGSRLLSRCKGCSPTQARNRMLPQRVSILNGQRRHRTRLPPAAQEPRPGSSAWRGPGRRNQIDGDDVAQAAVITREVGPFGKRLWEIGYARLLARLPASVTTRRPFLLVVSKYDRSRP